MGAVAGGLLGAAALPLATAMADNSDAVFGSGSPLAYTFDPDSDSPLTVTGLYNVITAPPGADESIQGYREFSVIDAHGDPEEPPSTFSAYQTTVPYLNADRTGEVLFVTSDLPGSDHTTGDVPPDGSVFGYLSNGLFQNYYSAIPGSGGGITDILKTPLGPLDFSGLFQLLGFDAADVRNVLPSYITPVGGDDSQPTFTAITGLPPVDVAVQGYQQFEFHDGDSTGTFDAVQTKTTDFMGFHTEALLVTGPAAGTPAGDVPPVDSIFNTMELNALPGLQLVYSSLPTSNGDDVVKTVFTIPTLGWNLDVSGLFQSFDASAGLADGTAIQPVDFSIDNSDYTIKPVEGSTEQFTGINGLPPFDAAIQGIQTFNIVDEDGATVESFNANVTSMPQMWWTDNSLALVVTGITGSAQTGDPVLPVGSVFNIVNYGSGFQDMYYDLPGIGPDGANLIKDLYTIPGLGPIDVSWLAQSTDAAAGLTDVAYAGSAWTDLLSAP